MKRIILTALLLFSMSAGADIISGTGKIYRLDNNAGTLNATGEDWSLVRIEGFSSAGSCFASTHDNVNYVKIVIRNDHIGSRMYAMLLAAQLRDVPVTVYVDDGYKTNDNCYLQQVSLDF